MAELLEFAGHEFELDTPQGDGETLRAHLMAAAKQTRKVPEQLMPKPLPRALAHVWDYFMELNLARDNNGFKVKLLSYSEIKSWSELTRRQISAFEVGAIKALDVLYVSHHTKRKAKE
jgi:hypothetical protein